MRHFLSAVTVSGLPAGVSRATAASILIAATGLEHTLAPRRSGAFSSAKALAAIAGFADDNLGATAHAKIKATGGLGHRRFLGNAEERESSDVDVTRGRCDT
ncbi:MAG TPA: hypothetical protein VJQ52_08565 [Steroidobacteraceae bacterium]|nr:hypothetical protein [Steroidobacteraceae bacterium]